MKKFILYVFLQLVISLFVSVYINLLLGFALSVMGAVCAHVLGGRGYFDD